MKGVTMMKKLKTLMLVFAAAAIVLPTSVFALTLKEVKDVTKSNGDLMADAKASYREATVEDLDEHKNITLTYDALGLEVLDTDGERPKGYAWVGMQVEAPDSISAESVKFKFNGGTEEQFEADEDGYFLWTAVVIDKLKEAVENDEPYTFNYVIAWDGDFEGENTQTITVKIDPYKVTLHDASQESEENQTVWSPTIAQEVKDAVIVEPAPTEPDETNPNTGDINAILLGGLMLLGSFGLAYTVKRRYQ